MFLLFVFDVLFMFGLNWPCVVCVLIVCFSFVAGVLVYVCGLC